MVTGVLYLAAVRLGPIPVAGLRDPTRAMFDFPADPLRAAYAGSDFVLIDNWRLGGRVGVALGPGAPICAMGGDPRGFAFACDARRRLGQSALIVSAADKGEASDATPYFRSVEPLGALSVGRRGAAERSMTLERGHDLTRAPPLPYGP